MKLRILLLLAVVLMLISLAPGQERMVSQSDQDVIRVTVGLVQVDAVVTDSKGKHVVDLKPEDFEVTQDGKPQKITHFTFVSTTSPKPAATPQPVRTATKSKVPIPPPPVGVKPNQIQRTMAFVVDDLGLSFESIAYVRKALQKFVDTQMQPGDLVAVVRTGAGMGALQAFTQDPRVLKAAIDKVKWNPMGRVGVSSFRPIGSDEGSIAETEFYNRIYSVGTLGAINYIVTGLKELPGRKSVILFTESMRMFNRDQSTDEVYDAYLNLADEANRASTVIYTIDPRGLPTLQLTAADRVTDTRPDHMAQQQMQRTQEHWDSQEGMSYLADKTGGMFIHNTNDISGGIGKIIEDQVGYYLIGWSPGSDVFENADPKKAKELYRKYHKIRIHLKNRPGLSIRTRDGYYGKPDTNERPTYRTRDEQLFAALQSPFGSSDIPVRLTALFSNNAKAGSYVYSLLHIDAKNLTFEEEVATDEKTGAEKKGKDGKPEIWQKAVIDILMITFGDNGQEIDRGNQTYTVRVRGETYKRVLKDGFIYQMNHPIKKPGAYQLRAAVRDAGSGKAGSASQFIEVPDVTKGKLVLSGIVLKERDPSMPAPAAAPGQRVSNGNGNVAPAPGAQNSAPPQVATKQAPPGDDDDAQGGPALRNFRPGKLLTYGVQVINAKADGGKHPEVDTQLHLYRDGKEIYVGKPIPVQIAEQPDPKRLVTGGYLRLGSAMEPGDYVLQIVATDRNAPDKNNTATQWIDFVIAKKN